MIGRGLLRHRFHGTYTAVLILGFDTPEAAAAALPIVGAPFEVSTEPRALVAVFTSEALDTFKVQHAARIAILPCGFRHCSRTLSRCKATAIDAGEVLPPPAPRKPRTPRPKRGATPPEATPVDAPEADTAPFPADAYPERAALRCKGCGASGFRYLPSGRGPGYECMTCGKIKAARSAILPGGC